MIKKNRYFFPSIGVLLVALSGCFVMRSATNSAINLANLQEKSSLMPIAIIGSGPAGLMAGVYGARGGKDTFIIEGNKSGGLLMDTTEVENWPGEIAIAGPQIIEKLRAQALHHGVTFVEDTVERIDTRQWPYALYTESGQVLHALTVIIATGATPRRLQVVGEEQYWGMGVTACAICDGAFYKDKDVVVVGGGDSAIEEAMQLASYARSITILVRKERMRAAVSMQAKLKAYGKIAIKYGVEIASIEGTGEKVTEIKLRNLTTGTIERMPIDGVFLAIGHDPNTAFVHGVLECDKAGYIKVHGRTQATGVPGIFAAGDVEDHRYRQAGVAVGYGIAAGLDAVRFLDDLGYTPTVAADIASNLYSSTTSTHAIHRGFGSVIELTAESQFTELMGKKGLVFVDFWSETCPSCKRMLPLFKEVAAEYKEEGIFVSVDVDAVPALVEKLFVHKVPCFLVFEDGVLRARFSDTMSRKELGLFIEQFIKKGEVEK